MKNTFVLMGLLLALNCPAFAQSGDMEKARSQARIAVGYYDEGKYGKAKDILEEVVKANPDFIAAKYELGLTLFAMKSYKKAAKIGEEIRTSPEPKDYYFTLLGNCYDMMKQPEKAEEAYKAGLEKFPNSGPIYTELGIFETNQKHEDKALGYWEKGIENDPLYASNYYHAARTYYFAKNHTWSIMYGEIFMNLERNTERNKVMSAIIALSYQEMFPKKGTTINMKMNKEEDQAKRSVAVFFSLSYSYNATECFESYQKSKDDSLNANYINDMRSCFIDKWFTGGNDKNLPNIVFDYQKQLKESGYMECYNRWLVRWGKYADFEKWRLKNEKKFTEFSKWFSGNAMPVTEANHFYKAQYNEVKN